MIFIRTHKNQKNSIRLFEMSGNMLQISICMLLD